MIEERYVLHTEPFAVTFEVFRCEVYRVTIDYVLQEDGSHKWAIRNGNRSCLSTSGKWDFEAMPSHRPEDWIATHRFDSFDDAWALAREAADDLLKEYKRRVRLACEAEAIRKSGFR